jgi:Inner membrane component of T3SS, cytoplasmic domain/Protein of unknown function (DUF3662)
VNVFEQLETICANAVERTFALAFPSALEPVQIARKLVGAFEAGGSTSGRGGRRFIVRMSAADYARFEPDRAYLERQWGAMLARLAERSGRPQRAPDVRAEIGAAVASGTVSIAVEALPEPARLALRVRKGVPPNARVQLDRATLVGRDPACDLVLSDPRVSRRHLEIVPDGAVLRFRDLGSSNGTILNGVSATSGEIGLGDVLVLGDSELSVDADESAR